MFNVGGPELIVIAMVALIVLGPDKLPGALRTAGRVMGELRKISAGFQTDLRTALADAERQAESEAAAAKASPNSAGPPPGVEAGSLAAQAELAALGTGGDANPEKGAESEQDAADDGDETAGN